MMIRSVLLGALVAASGLAHAAELRYSMFQPPRTIEARATAAFLEELGRASSSTDPAP
jgi:hypothetical protein